MEDIKRRARELASINGIPPTVLSEKYLLQARRELAGENLPPTSGEDIEAVGAMTRDPSDPLSISGHQIPTLEDPDGQQDLERLTEEGVEEAQHEQMIAARRRARHEDKK
jgi:hypothetical protein